jgi:hypothetical protein
VSTPATLTPVGYLQFETGVLGASHSPEFSSRYGLNTVMKLSVASRLELITSAEPFVQYHADSTSTNGTAEVFLGAQGVLSRGEDLKPTSRQAIFAASTMAMCRSLILGALAIHFSFLPAGTLRDFTTTQTPSSMSKLKRLCIELSSARRSPFHITWWKLWLSGEIWHFTQPFLHSHAVGNLWAVSYAARKTLVFDAGFNRGLTSTSTRWEAFLGFTYLLPHRLW